MNELVIRIQEALYKAYLRHSQEGLWVGAQGNKSQVSSTPKLGFACLCPVSQEASVSLAYYHSQSTPLFY